MFPGMQQFGQGLASDPFFNIGMGLLSAAGPSLNPGDVGIGQGLSRGMQSLARGQQGAQAAQLQQMQMQMAQAKLKREEDMQRLALEQRKAYSEALPGLISQVAPQYQETLTQLAAAAPDKVMGLLAPMLKPNKPNSPIESYEYSRDQFTRGGGSAASFPSFDVWNRANKKSGASSTTVKIPGAPPFGTSLGKTANDWRLAVQTYGADHPVTRALERELLKMTQADQQRQDTGVTIEALNPALAALEKDPELLKELSGLKRGLAQFLLPGALENASMSPAAQRYVRNSTEWLGKNLKLDSGADVRPDEFTRGFNTYFVAPGDSLEVIADKQARRTAREAELKEKRAGATGGGDKPSTVAPVAPDAAEIQTLEQSLNARLEAMKAAQKPGVAAPVPTGPATPRNPAGLLQPSGVVQGNTMGAPGAGRRPIKLPVYPMRPSR